METNLPSKYQQPAVPDYLKTAAAADAGAGVSTDRDDNIVPLIYVLQTNSPQCNKRDERYIDGAEPGDIWLRNAAEPIVKGDVGVVVQPCAFWKDVVEWIPRDDGGGFVGRHDAMPRDAKQEPNPKNPNGPDIWVTPDGNELKETRNHAVIAYAGDDALPYSIPLTSTGHQVSREWMFKMGRKVVGTTKLPSWACLYRLTTRLRQRKDQSWFVLQVDDEGFATEGQYEMGKTLHEAFAAGIKKADAPDAVADADAAANEDVPF